MIEEVVKVVPLLLLAVGARVRWQRGLTDYVLLGGALGAGFGLLEAVMRFGTRDRRGPPLADVLGAAAGATAGSDASIISACMSPSRSIRTIPFWTASHSASVTCGSGTALGVLAPAPSTTLSADHELVLDSCFAVPGPHFASQFVILPGPA